jgi:actin-related protein
MFQDMTSLVVDIGTARARIGYGGDDAPLLMPHSLLSSYAEGMHDADRPRYNIGDKHLSADRPDNEVASIFAKRGPEGYQYDYDRLETFLQHNLTNELGVDVKDYSVLLSEDVAAKPAENREIREKVTEFLFERLNAANVFFMKAPVLACFATGKAANTQADRQRWSSTRGRTSRVQWPSTRGSA